jgi:phosphoribosylanthranilate isomerase
MTRPDSPSSIGFVVKVCGITRREDALAVAEAGASAIGFIFYPKSPRYITPEAAAHLSGDLSLWKVGVFVNESPAAIEAVMRAAHLDIAQIYGSEAIAGVRVWKAHRVEKSVPDAFTTAAEAILLDGTSNGTAFDWSVARDFARQNPSTRVIVAGGLNASNVGEAIRVVRPWGVDASSSLEISPGVKDRESVRRFVKAALDAAEQENSGREHLGLHKKKELS